MKLAAGAAIKAFLQGLKIFAIKAGKKAFLIAIVLFGLGFVGLLPPCPFRLLNTAIASEQSQSMAILRYIPVFIPIFEMMSFFSVWVLAIGSYYAVKVFLRIGKVI